jgi:hypothetical protein
LALVLALATVAAVAASDVHTEAGPGVTCDQRYALCTSAPCVPDPRDPDKSALCECAVRLGISFGMTSCEDRQPKSRGGVTLLVSTYSLAEYRTKATMTCPGGRWTFCLDKPCTVDPMDPLRAVCACDVKPSEEFLTLGGDCNTLTCDSAYWSGATPTEVAHGEAAMVRALGLESPPDNACYLGQPHEEGGNAGR